MSFTIGNLLDIRTFITHHLLSHLEAARPELRCPHLLPAVALPLARGLFGNRLVTHNLDNSRTHIHNVQYACNIVLLISAYTIFKTYWLFLTSIFLFIWGNRIWNCVLFFFFFLDREKTANSSSRGGCGEPVNEAESCFHYRPRQSFQSTLLQVWPPGLVWYRFLWECSGPVAVDCLRTWSRSRRRSFKQRARVRGAIAWIILSANDKSLALQIHSAPLFFTSMLSEPVCVCLSSFYHCWSIW